MKGTIAIAEVKVRGNRMGWTEFDFFKHECQHLNGFIPHWYAYKLVDGVYYFRWAVGIDLPSKRVLNLLKKDKWILK